MQRTLIVTALLLAASLAGCIGDDDASQANLETVTWDQRPEDTQEGESMTVAWTPEGSVSQASSTGIAYGRTSHGDPTTPNAYGGTAGVSEDVSTGEQQATSLTLNETGEWYLRAWAKAPDGGDYVFSPEVQIQVSESGPGVPGPILVTLDDAPTTARTGENVTMNWTVNGPPGETVTRT
ncbi:MAG: hypothetical protein R3185_03715, partial [Candidatus Thermoplasmatota archaeon]|nr:hypothetical protein [Candidatus Thermoplasmatota archaeon]